MPGRASPTPRQTTPTAPQRERTPAPAVVGALIKRPNAIGFFLYRRDEHLDKRIRVLGIVPEQGREAGLPHGRDGCRRQLSLDRFAHALSATGRAAIGAGVLQVRRRAGGAKIVKQCGLWPEYELNQVRGVTRLADVKAHRGAEVAVSGSPAWQGMMKELGTEFSKAKTAVEIKYHAGTQDAAIGEFVGGEQDAALTPCPSPEYGRGEKDPAPLPSRRGEQREAMLLIDSILDDKTVTTYDKAWSAIKPREVLLGWRAAGIVVHPTNPVSVISFRQLRDVFSGKIKDWWGLMNGGTGISVERNLFR